MVWLREVPAGFKLDKNHDKYTYSSDGRKLCLNHKLSLCWECIQDHRLENMVKDGVDSAEAKTIIMFVQTVEDKVMEDICIERPYPVHPGSQCCRHLFTKHLFYDLDDLSLLLENFFAKGRKALLKLYQLDLAANADIFFDKYKLEKLDKYASRCISCRYNIGLERNALVCGCGAYWYCSTQCLQKYPGHSSEPHQVKCLESNYEKSILKVDNYKAFMKTIEAFFNKETAKPIHRYVRKLVEENVTRSQLKLQAENGDAQTAFLIGLTYQFRFVSDKNETEICILPPFGRSRPFSNGKAIKYMLIAIKTSSKVQSQALFALGMLLMGYDRRTALDYVYRSSCAGYEPATRELRTSFPSYHFQEDLIMKLADAGTRKILSHCQGLELVMRYPDQFLNPDQPLASEPGFARLHGLAKLLKQFKRPLDLVLLIYGRGSAELLEFKSRPRPIENILYKNTSGECHPGTKEDLCAAQYDKGYFRKLSTLQPRYLCPHETESIGNICIPCGKEALERIQSVYMNRYFMSQSESLGGFYYSVIFYRFESCTKTLHMCEEPFQNFSKCEISFTLKILSQNPHDLHVSQIAKNPDLYWPIIFYYGSVYNALSSVAGKEAADSVYSKFSRHKPECSNSPSFEYLFPIRSDRIVLKCGNNSCHDLDIEFTHDRCTRCKIRRYCSQACQKKDWKLHKPECFPRSPQTDEEKTSAKEVPSAHGDPKPLPTNQHKATNMPGKQVLLKKNSNEGVAKKMAASKDDIKTDYEKRYLVNGDEPQIVEEMDRLSVETTGSAAHTNGNSGPDKKAKKKRGKKTR